MSLSRSARSAAPSAASPGAASHLCRAQWVLAAMRRSSLPSSVVHLLRSDTEVHRMPSDSPLATSRSSSTPAARSASDTSKPWSA